MGSVSAASLSGNTKFKETHIVEDEIFAMSRKCNKIVNRRTGNTELRHIGEGVRWELVFKNAYKNPTEFQLFYDTEGSEAPPEGRLLDKNGDPVYTEAELRDTNINELRILCKKYSVTGKTRSEMIVNIMKVQEEL